jgi:hypothetical protein
MARAVALGTLVARAQARADRQEDGSIATTEWKGYISELYAELHKLVRAARYFETEATITATGASGYALPADHLETIGIDYVDSGGRRRALRPVPALERPRYAGLTGDAFGFALEASNVVFYGNPSSGTYKHLYIPQPTDYSGSADSTSVDVINIDGEKFILWGVASIAQHKSDANQQRALAERDKAERELQAWAAERMLDNPRRVEADPYGAARDDADWWPRRSWP